jgi:hypothetical protein
LDLAEAKGAKKSYQLRQITINFGRGLSGLKDNKK